MRFYWTPGTFTGHFSLAFPKQHNAVVGTDVLEAVLDSIILTEDVNTNAFIAMIDRIFVLH